jgi:hypothetical protein
MIRTKYIAVSIITAMAVLAPHLSIGGSDAVTPEESERVIRELYALGGDMYRKYSGVESLRKEIINEYDPANNALRSVSELTTKRMDYFYDDAIVEVQAYKKDGKEMDRSKFKPWKSKPTYPVFDEKGRDNYSVRIAERKIINGRGCYRVQVLPRKETSRHFRGDVYYTVKKLEAVYIDGTVAKLDFPLKYFKIELELEPKNGVPVISSGKVHVRVNVPLFYPDTMIVTSMTVLESRLIPSSR